MSTDAGELPALETDLEELDDDEVIDLRPPNLKSSRVPGGELWKLRRRRKKRQRLAKKGHVQWYLIDDGFPEPKFVKPKLKGAGIPEVKHNGNRYLFPEKAMVANKTQGMWTVIHKKGEADPINLRDPSKSSIPCDELEEFLNMRATSSPPSLFDQFDLEAEDLVKYLIVGIIGIAVLQSVLGGGF